MTNQAMWRFASASVIGTSHQRAGTPCQDCHACRLFRSPLGEPTIAIAVSDGAGSAGKGEIGAAIVCAALLEQVEIYLAQERTIASFTEDDAQTWLRAVRESIVEHADQNDHVMREYACTLLLAVIGVDTAAFLQIGDGAIVTANEFAEWSWVFWPHRGEFANTTYFVTDDNASDNLMLEVRSGRTDEVALFTDGIEPLVLQYVDRTVYVPFFERMFEPVRRSSEAGEDLELSTQLESYLSSSAINNRTDDDKTLLLATRRESDVSSSVR